MGWLNETASANIPDILVTLETFHLPISWLNISASLNISDISVTFDTSQLPMGWLNETASANISDILVTLETFQLLISWLNISAWLNIPDILVTFETSQLPISWLNEVALVNIPDISVTFDKSGISVAVIIILIHPLNASFIVAQWVVPHCLISSKSLVYLNRICGAEALLQSITMVCTPLVWYSCSTEEMESPVVSSKTPSFSQSILYGPPFNGKLIDDESILIINDFFWILI